MQTFLPYADFKQSAQCLDMKRLGKQRVEALQIHNIVSGKRTSGGWINHPALLMWQGHADALADYHNAMIDEWVQRGYKNNMPYLPIDSAMIHYPQWLGVEALHASHRSNLLRKQSDHYNAYSWSEPSDLPYYWPSPDRCDCRLQRGIV